METEVRQITWRSQFLKWMELLLWPAAVLLLRANAELADNFAPLPAAFADPAMGFTVWGFLSARLLASWGLLFAIVGIVPRLLWKSDLRPISLLTAVVILGDESTLIQLSSLTAPLLALALAVLGACWAQAGGGDGVKRWLYRDAALGAGAVAALGILYLWVVHFPLRETAGLNPAAGFSVFLAACGGAAVFVWRRAPHRRAAVLYLSGLALLALPIQHRAFDENNRVFAYEKVLGGEPEPPTIILLVIDTLRADALSYRNASAPATPHLDALADESVVFENAIAPSSWTFPSMTTLMTGVAPLSDIDSTSYVYFTPRRRTLAQRMQAAGYHTRAIVGNHLLYRPFNVADGFHKMETYASFALGQTAGHDGRLSYLSNWFPRSWRYGVVTEKLTDRAIEWARNSAGRPSFLWLHYFDPHDPYTPPERYRRQELAALSDGANSSTLAEWRRLGIEDERILYNSEVRFVDAEIGRFVTGLKRTGLYDDAVIIVTSDHGEEFLEHGRFGHGPTFTSQLCMFL